MLVVVQAKGLAVMETLVDLFRLISMSCANLNLTVLCRRIVMAEVRNVLHHCLDQIKRNVIMALSYASR